MRKCIFNIIKKKQIVDYLLLLFCIVIFYNKLFSSGLYAQNSAFDASTLNTDKVINVNWHDSEPFIYLDKNNNLVGIEYEIILGFKDYMLSRHNIDLKINWISRSSLVDVINEVSTAKEDNNLGATALSITSERESIIDFSDPYFVDIAVLISNGNDKVITEFDDFKRMTENGTAVTIKGTTYEKMLLDLKRETNININIEYVTNNIAIINNITKNTNKYGFIDLPIYLLFLQNGAKIQRHEIFPIEGTGFGIAFPKNSVWKRAFDKYLEDPITQFNNVKILEKYLGSDIYLFVNELKKAQRIEESILAKEKAYVQQNLNDVTSNLESEKQIRFFLSLTISFVIILLLIVLFLLFYVSKKNKRLQLSESKLIRERDMRSMNNKRLMNRNVQLNEMSEERNTLFHMVVHDLRSPINNIQGLIELFQNKEVELRESERDSLLKKMHESCIRMNQLIDQIFASEKGGIQKKNSLNEELDLVELFSNTVDNFSTGAQRKQIKLVFDEAPRSCEILSDYLQLTQIFENLISNAIKFSPKSSQITLSINCTETDAIVKIKDNGPGFSEDDKLNLFKVFQPLTAKPTNGEKSTGLGLAIVKRCCDAIGASLSLDEDYKDGALFVITIPRNIHTM